MTPGYDTAPRYLGQHVVALAGRRLRGGGRSTSTRRRPTAARRTRSSARRSSTRPTSACSRTSTPSTTTRATTSSRRTSRRPIRAASRPRRRRRARRRWRRWSHKVMLELRDYANKGGKLLVDGRNVHQAFTSTQREPVGDRPVHLDAGQALRVLLPAEQRGRRRPARHRLAAFARHLQRHLAELPRRRRPPVRHRRGADGDRQLRQPEHRRVARWPARPAASSTAWRRSTLDQTAGNDPNQNADGTPLPQPRIPLRLRNWGPTNEPLRAETIQADYATPVT